MGPITRHGERAAAIVVLARAAVSFAEDGIVRADVVWSSTIEA
jgi:hypothetical protein